MAKCPPNHLNDVIILFLTLSWITILARIWARAGILKKWGRDDWAMLLAQVLFTGCLAAQICELRFGLGACLEDLLHERERAEVGLMYFWIAELLYCLATATMKIAIALQLLRIGIERLHVWVLRSIIVFVAMVAVISSVVVIFQCWPVQKFWTLDSVNGHCISLRGLRILLLCSGAGIVCFDLMLSILPVFMMSHLQMRLRRKIIVISILALGGIASIATIVRLFYVRTLWLPTAGNGAGEKTLAYSVPYIYLSNIEVGVGIMAGSIATLSPLLKALRGQLGIESTRNNVRRMKSWHPSSSRASKPSVGNTGGALNRHVARRPVDDLGDDLFLTTLASAAEEARQESRPSEDIGQPLPHTV